MLNELRERGSLRSLLQRPEVTGGEGGENAQHRLAITIFHLFYQRENGCGLMQQGDYVLFFLSPIGCSVCQNYIISLLLVFLV